MKRLEKSYEEETGRGVFYTRSRDVIHVLTSPDASYFPFDSFLDASCYFHRS